MTGRRRYHPFFALRFMRRTLLLYLVPLVQVLFRRDWAALSTALAQDLVLFCLLAAVSWVMLHASSWELDAEGVLRLRWDLVVSFERTIQGSQLYTVYDGAAGEHVIRMMIPKAGLSAFSLTFG